MKKITFSIILITLVVLTPIISMAISPTRDLLLGLAPDEAVLKLADEIDRSRIENQAKVIELESKLAEYESKLTEQEKSVNEISTKVEIETTANSTNSNSAAEISSACSKITYYENSYKSRDGSGKSVSFTKGENNIKKYYDLRSWIKSEYKDADSNWKGGTAAVISNIEKDYQDYLKNKDICK